MRISTNTIFTTNVTQLNTIQDNMTQTQQQISTGRRMLTPADDPVAAALALQVTQAAGTNTQYIANIGTAQNATALSEGALQSVKDLLTSVQTTTVQAGSSTLSNSDRATLANTLKDSLTQLVSLANSTDAVGNYLFSGFKGATQPFVQTSTGVQYNGNDGQRLVQVSSSQQLGTTDSGANIFMRIKNGNGVFATGTSQTIPVAGTNVMAGAALGAPITFGTPATYNTFTVDGTAVTVSQSTPPSTLSAAIQAGLSAAGLASYSVSAAAGGGLQIVHTGSTTPVAITLANGPAIANGIVNSAGTAGVAATATPNTGTGIISQGTVANPPPTAAQLGNSYQINFIVAGGVTTYSVKGTDSTGAALPTGAQPLGAPPLLTLPTAQPYTSGQSIILNGVQFDIQGAPASGDSFTVKPSANESVFTTIQNLINTLNAPVAPSNPATSTQLSAGVNTALNNLGNALNSVLTAEAAQGTRLNQLTSLNTTEGVQGNNLKQTLSTLQDLDYNKAVSDLTQQQTILKAAQQSFVSVEGLSMFNYMR